MGKSPPPKPKAILGLLTRSPRVILSRNQASQQGKSIPAIVSFFSFVRLANALRLLVPILGRSSRSSIPNSSHLPGLMAALPLPLLRRSGGRRDERPPPRRDRPAAPLRSDRRN